MSKVRRMILYLVLILVGLMMLLPFYMMFVMSTLSTSEIYSFPPRVWFGGNLVANIRNMMDQVDIVRAFVNSLIVTLSYTFLCLLFCSMGGYAFASYEFPGKGKLFGLLLVTMMIPFTAGIIPWFMMMSKLGWISDRGNDYGAIMLASTCAVLPLLIAFLCSSKFFMSGLTAGAVKE